RTNKTNTANDGELGTNVDRVAADIDVAVIQYLQDLRQRQPVRIKSVQVDIDVEGFALASPAGYVDDSRHGTKPAREYPFLKGFEIRDAVVRWARKPVAIDFSDRTSWRYRRLRLVGQRRQLAEPVQHPLFGLFISQVIGELQLHIGESEQRNRPHRSQIGNGRDRSLDGYRNIALDLLGGLAGALGDDIDKRWHRIRIGYDVQLNEGDSAGQQE